MLVVYKGNVLFQTSPDGEHRDAIYKYWDLVEGEDVQVRVGRDGLICDVFVWRGERGGGDGGRVRRWWRGIRT